MVALKLIYGELTYKINGVLFKVHNKLGRYLNEKQYCDLIEQYLKDLKIKYEREKVLPKSFETEEVGRNKVDFFVESKIIIEIKAKRIITREDYFQIRRYLSSLNKKLGILVNFHSRTLHPKRILNSLAKE